MVRTMGCAAEYLPAWNCIAVGKVSQTATPEESKESFQVRIPEQMQIVQSFNNLTFLLSHPAMASRFRLKLSTLLQISFFAQNITDVLPVLFRGLQFHGSFITSLVKLYNSIRSQKGRLHKYWSILYLSQYSIWGESDCWPVFGGFHQVKKLKRASYSAHEMGRTMVTYVYNMCIYA